MTDDSQALRADLSGRAARSALWAAWGDALGFISELTDQPGLERRLNGSKSLTEPVAWVRRVGGKFGVEAELPAGCYSDDTQLRLAVSRAINSHGFDAEAFARVELPVWPTYALGGGISTKAAAVNLAKGVAPWFANFYRDWSSAGGNGAAMRIQPHVWANLAMPSTERQFLADTLTDALITHGHAFGLVGAVLNAAVLRRFFDLSADELAASDVRTFSGAFDSCQDVAGLTALRSEISAYWAPSWEAEVGRPLEQVWTETLDLGREMLSLVERPILRLRELGEEPQNGGDDSESARVYMDILDKLGLRTPKLRGSGLHTVVAAIALAIAYPGNPRTASLRAAQAVGSDTDTIATMAAAMAGAAIGAPDCPPVLDGKYIESEARRMVALSHGENTATFAYPDLLHWQPPRSQIEGVGLADGSPALSGLTWLEDASLGDYEAKDAVWRWTLSSSFPAHFLTKQRRKLRVLAKNQWPVDSHAPSFTNGTTPLDGANGPGGLTAPAVTAPATRSETAPPEPPPTAGRIVGLARERTGDGNRTPRPPTRNRRPDVDETLEWLRTQSFSNYAIGYAVRRMAEYGSIEQTIALGTALRAELSRPADSHKQVERTQAGFDLEGAVRRYFQGRGVDSPSLSSTDDGIDGIYTDASGARVVLQVKRSAQPVGATAVQELKSVLDRLEGTRGILVSTSRFTAASARDAREDGRIELVSGETLLNGGDARG